MRSLYTTANIYSRIASRFNSFWCPSQLVRRTVVMKPEEINRKAVAAEEMITILRDQVKQLQSFIAENGGPAEQKQIAELKKENDKLRNDITQMKFELEFLEVQNGATAVPLPTNSGKIAVKKDETSGSNDKTANAVKNAPKVQEKETKKDKVQPEKKKEGNKKENAAKSEEEGKPVDCSRLCLKIGKIVNVKHHPDADTLYVEEVDVGEERNRTILSGLVKSVPIEEMQGRIAVFMCNLKPAKMRGILSEGMIMCAVTPEKTEIIQPPEGSCPGDRVYFEGFEGNLISN